MVDLNNQGLVKKISVITATYNAAKYLPTLIESLQKQTDKDFEWVVADGGSTDGTLALLAEIKDINIVISSQPDFGIYDALNRGIKLCSGDYYVVAGADDYFYESAIVSFRKAINVDIDIVTATIHHNDQLIEALNKADWLYGMRSYVSSHSVGALFKKSLHNTFGFYSNKLPITADNLFILKIMKAGAKRKEINDIVGIFGMDGVSSIDIAGSLVENFRAQLLVGSNKYIQFLLLCFRLLKNIGRY